MRALKPYISVLMLIQFTGTATALAVPSTSYEDPFYQQEFMAVSNATQGALDVFCSRCHTPIGVVSAEVLPIIGFQDLLE